MGGEYYPLTLRPLNFWGRVIFGIWILGVVRDRRSECIAVNENRGYKGQRGSEQRRYRQLRGQATDAIHKVETFRLP